MWIFNIFSKVWRKLTWLINFIKVYILPIYKKLKEIIAEVSGTNLENDAAKAAVFQKITDFMQANGIKIPDSILNLSIEIVYQLYKNGKA